jgi:chromosome partitioning protein
MHSVVSISSWNEVGMLRTYVLAAPKGGTGKTTTTVNVGAALVEIGLRVLAVDVDPTAHLTTALGAPTSLEHTLYSAIESYSTTYLARLDAAIVPTSVGVDLVPADERLHRADSTLKETLNGTLTLRHLLEPIAAHYDVVLLDTLSSFGMLTRTALAAADRVIIPIEPEPLAAQVVSVTLDLIEQMRRSRINPTLSVAGVLLTMVDDRTRIHRKVVADIREAFGDDVFSTVIKRSVRVPESQAYGQSMLQYDPEGEVAHAYRALVRELGYGTT